MGQNEVIVISALADELGSEFYDVTRIHTGIGKVRAAIGATHAINLFKPKTVINFGTAACKSLPHGSLVRCFEIYQTDLDLTAIGGTNYINDRISLMPLPFMGIESRPLLTSDRFIDTHQIDSWAVHDMEGYAIAQACKELKCKMICIKGISDQGDPDQWAKNIGQFSKRFRQIFDNIISGPLDQREC